MSKVHKSSSPLGDLAKLGAISLAPAALFATAVTRRVRTWGTTVEELARIWPGDHLVPHPSIVWTNAVTIDRPAAEVWPWVNQLGQGRGGLYSYDWLENALLADVHSVNQVQPALQGPLEVGDKVIRMTRYAPHNPVALYEPGHALVLGGVNDSEEQLRAGCPTSTWAFIVDPVDAHRCRLVVRSRARAPDVRVQGPIQFVMQRRMMLGIKQRAEDDPEPGAADVWIPVSWLVGALVVALHATRALRADGRSAPDEIALASIAAVAVEVLLFWDLPMPLRAFVVAALANSAASHAGRTIR